MPTNLKSTSDFWVQNENDTAATGNTGASSALATRLGALNPDIGLRNDTAANSDTGTFSLIAMTKRLLQRFSTLLTALPAALTPSGNFKVAVQERVIPTYTTWRDVSILASVKQVSSTPIRTYGWHFINLNTIPVYVHLYDAASGSVTPGTTTPIFTIALPAIGGDRESVRETPQLTSSTALSLLATTSLTAISAPAIAVQGFVVYA